MMVFTTILCGILLLVVTIAFVFSKTFRNDVVVGEGETKFFGILNAKGAIIIVVLAMFLGATLYASGKSSITIEKIRKVIPKEAPVLTQTIRTDLQALKNAHISIVKLYVSGLRKDVEKFFETEYLPMISEKVASNQSVLEDLAKALASDKPNIKLSTIFTEINVDQQKILLEKRAEMVNPINEQETMILKEISKEYDRIFETNQIINDFLESVK